MWRTDTDRTGASKRSGGETDCGYAVRAHARYRARDPCRVLLVERAGAAGTHLARLLVTIQAETRGRGVARVVFPANA